MPRRVGFSGQHLTLKEISDHHADLEASLRLYFNDVHPQFVVRFFGYTAEQVASSLLGRIEEVNTTSAFTVLSALEAAFRIDYLQRCHLRKKDRLLRAFRNIYQRKGWQISLEDEILETWKLHSTASGRIIGDLRGAFRFRHWIAHGRYWVPKLGQDYDFDAIYTLADETFETFPLEGI